MRYCRGVIAMLLMVFAGARAEAAAQQKVQLFSKAVASAAASPDRGMFLKIAKWSTLAGSAAAVGYGIAANRMADREYDEIERACGETPERCARLHDGAYADAQLDARYRDVVRMDDRAKLSLTAGQIGLAASVVLFILDLPRDAGTEDIPYEPGRLRIGPRTDGSLQAGYSLAR